MLCTNSTAKHPCFLMTAAFSSEARACISEIIICCSGTHQEGLLPGEGNDSALLLLLLLVEGVLMLCVVAAP